MRPVIQCKRHDIVKIPSIILSEFPSEMEKADELREKVRNNIGSENKIQKEKFQAMKAKYDREGIEHIKDEIELAEKTGSADGNKKAREKGERNHTIAMTKHGGIKPGATSNFSDIEYTSPYKDVNMGTDNDNNKNPLSMFMNAARKTFNAGGKPPSGT